MQLHISKKKIVKIIPILVFFCFCFQAGRLAGKRQSLLVSSMEQTKGKLAIVIDDFGYDGDGSEDILALPVPVTVALMPFSSATEKDYQQILEAKKEVIIHLPMEPLVGKPSWVGENGIFLSLSEEEIKNRVQQAVDKIPEATGLNNHMGSAIMEDRRAFSAILDVVKEHNLMFLDSVTTANSLAEELTKERNIPLLKRDVFLDGTTDICVVKENLKKAASVALKDGSAIAIGHVGPEGGKITAKAISDLAPELEKQGIEFVTLSQLKPVVEE